MTTRRIEWEEGRSVTAVTTGDGPPVLLAHGAGAGRSHPWMTGIAGRLGARGFRVTSFDYPYMAEGRRAPDRPATLITCHLAVRRAVVADSGSEPFLAGKSMGGRIGSHLQVDSPGLVFFGYPLVGVGKKEPRDTGHLVSSRTPMLFIQGDRDRLAPLELLEPVVTSIGDATLEIVTDADHSLRVPKRTGIPPEAMLDRLADVAARWMRDQAGGG